jgi:hypothetical protein
MTPRWSRAIGGGLSLLAFGGTAGVFVFGVLSGEGGRDHVRNIILGVLCAVVPLGVGALSAFRSNRRIRTEIEPATTPSLSANAL